MVLSEIITQVLDFIISTISSWNYPGIFCLMVAESALIPFPSEIIMPFAGYLVSTGNFNMTYVVIAGTFGNLLGSFLIYYLSKKLGREFILKYGKYLLIKQIHLQLTEKYFKKYGDKSIFIARMLPIVRGLVSIPAGLAEMQPKKYLIYTTAGCIIWNIALTYMGIALGSNWKNILHYSDYLDIIVIIGTIIFIIILIKIKKDKNNDI